MPYKHGNRTAGLTEEEMIRAWGAVDRETPTQQHRRQVAAVAAVIASWSADRGVEFDDDVLRSMAEECIAAMEVGF